MAMATIEENNYLHQHAVHSSSLDSINQTNGQKQMKMLVYTPGETIGDAHLLLIADNRESIGANGKKQRKCGKGVVEHLQTFGVQCQSRILSVGDYLWLLQWVDWEGKQQELVLDYIVERKTWDDLKVSTYITYQKYKFLV
jgi:ERCC4-type nuclease